MVERTIRVYLAEDKWLFLSCVYLGLETQTESFTEVYNVKLGREMLMYFFPSLMPLFHYLGARKSW